MAKPLSLKEKLEAARRGGPAQPGGTTASSSPPEGPAAETSAEAEATPSPPAPAVRQAPPPANLGRPLTLKEKLAAARAGGAPASPVASAPAPSPAAPAEVETRSVAAEVPPAVPPPAPALGRPLSLKEKLAAARGAGGAAPSAPAAKPAAGAPAAKTAAPAAKAATRQLPPLEKMTDPKDVAEAARQSGAKKLREAAAKSAASAPAPAKPKAAPKDAKPQTVLPKPKKGPSAAALVAQAERRGFLIGSLFVSWVVVAWTWFIAGSTFFTVMMGRFMFPNVLAEPPSTVKVGLPTNFDPEDVNERFKAEWGFWIVRSTKFNGQDIVYALKSVCTHLGCPPNWLNGEQKFKCPCHGSGFYITGINFEGPAPRPLERFKVTVADDGQVLVDKSQIFQDELGQWADPDSYIVA